MGQFQCHLWHQWYEISLVHIDGVWCTLYQSAGCMDHYKPPNMQWFDGVVNSLKKKFERKILSGNCHVSLLMMLHKSYRHCGELYFHFFLRVFMYMQPFQNFIPHFTL